MADQDIIGIQAALEEEERKKKHKEAVEAAGGVITSPLAAAGTEMTPDEAKMAGTKQQKDKALQDAATQSQVAVPQSSLLATRLEEQAYQATPEDKATMQAKEFSQKLSEFGSLGQGVEDKVQAEFAHQAEMNDPTVVSLNIPDEELATITAPGVDPATMSKFMEDFNTLATGGKLFDADGNERDIDAGAFLSENQGLFNDQNIETGLDLIKASYPDPEMQKQMVSQAVAKGIIDADELTVTDVFDSIFDGVDLATIDSSTPMDAMGGLSVDDLVQFVGPDWHTKTVGEIGVALQGKKDQIHSSAKNIQEQLRNPQLPPAVRESLVNELTRLGATGVIQAEQEAQETVDKVNASGMVNFGGEMKDVEELLDDGNIQLMVGDYLSLDPEKDAKEIAKLKKDNPEFLEWIDSTFGDISDTAENMEGIIGGVKESTAANAEKIANHADELGLDSPLSPEIMKAIGFDPEAWSSEEVNFEDNPFIQALTAIAGSDSDIASKINYLDPTLRDQLVGLKEPELSRVMSYLKTADIASFGKINNSLESLKKATTVDEALKAAFPNNPEFASASNLKREMENLESLAKFGDKGAAEKLKDLNKYFGDGSLDNLAALQDKLGEGLGSFDLLKASTGSGNNFLQMKDSGPSYSSNDKFLAAVAGTGDKSMGSLMNQYGSHFGAQSHGQNGVQSLDRLQKMVDSGQLTEDFPGQIKQQRNKVIDQEVNQHAKNIDTYNGSSNMNNVFQAELDLENDISELKKDPRNAEVVAILESKLKKMQGKTSRMGMGWGAVVDTSKHFVKNIQFSSAEEAMKYFPGSPANIFVRKPNGQWRIKHVKEGGYNPDVQNAVGRRWTMDRKDEYRKKQGA